jgi:hypothetical protein
LPRGGSWRYKWIKPYIPSPEGLEYPRGNLLTAAFILDEFTERREFFSIPFSKKSYYNYMRMLFLLQHFPTGLKLYLTK